MSTIHEGQPDSRNERSWWVTVGVWGWRAAGWLAGYAASRLLDAWWP